MRKLILILMLMMPLVALTQVNTAQVFTISGQDVAYGINLNPGTIIIDMWTYENETVKRAWVLTGSVSASSTLRGTEDKVQLNPYPTMDYQKDSVFNAITLIPQFVLPQQPMEGMIIYLDSKLWQFQEGSWRTFVIFNNLGNN